MKSPMQVLIFGGTGTLGRQIARTSIDSGYKVRCMVRKPRSASFLQEWGCELTKGDLLDFESIQNSLEDVDAVIDAATSRPDDPKSVYQVDWEGKLNLYRACDAANVKRVVFLSLLAAEKYRNVPLMDIKYCTERLLMSSDLDYTIIQGAAFMQGVIGQFAIPILDSQPVWISGQPGEIAYMNSQDMAKFAVSALKSPKTSRKSFPVVGPKAWKADELVELCEKSCDRKARVWRVSPFVISAAQSVISFFESTLNVAERLSFAELSGSGISLNAAMEETYAAFGLDPAKTTTMENYIKEYYEVILKRLKDIGADLDKEEKKKFPI
tara:strand:- start:19106 stop:20080 length:975 start_codon:yes stop_codon:yes gene_type:complete